MRVLWWLLIGLALVWLFKSWRRQSDRVSPPADPTSTPSRAVPKPLAPQVMLRCAHCGMHLPQGEAIQADGRFFCSAAHRDAAMHSPAGD
jgi:uncharacterized protein